MKNLVQQLINKVEDSVVDSLIEAGEKVTEAAPGRCLGVFTYEEEYPTELLK